MPISIKDAPNLTGRTVIYSPWPNSPPEAKERGVITSSNAVNIFVRYGTKTYSEATSPSDLELEIK